jgi:hypothetical protein
MQDSRLIEGMSKLAEQWAPDAPIDEDTKKKILDLQQAVNDLVESRKLQASPDVPDDHKEIDALFDEAPRPQAGGQSGPPSA